MAVTSCRIASFRAFKVCLVCLKFDTQRQIVFLSGTASRRPSAKRMRNAHCVATGDPPIYINSSTIKARCYSNHAMVYIENGMYAAVRWRASHYCTHSLPEAMPLPNWGVLSAASCILYSTLYTIKLKICTQRFYCSSSKFSKFIQGKSPLLQ